MYQLRPTVSAGAEVVPPTLMIVFGHPALGAATLSVVLAAWVLQLRLVTRSSQVTQQALLSYAQGVSSLGGDPAAVIKALQDAAPSGAAPPEQNPPPHGEPEMTVLNWRHPHPYG